MYSLGACCQSSICPQAPSGQGFWQPEVPFDEAIVTGVVGVALVIAAAVHSVVLAVMGRARVTPKRRPMVNMMVLSSMWRLSVAMHLTTPSKLPSGLELPSLGLLLLLSP